MAAPLGAKTELFAESGLGLLSQIPGAPVSASPSPGFANIKRSYLEDVQALGYSESEGRFLNIVATHSAYFVARQFLAFTCGQLG